MLTNYAAKKLLDHVLGIADFTMPTEVWLLLLTADPTRAGSLTSEVPDSGTDYARQDVTGLLSATDSSLRTSILNSLITFPTAATSWGNISHVGIADAETVGTGNLLMYRRLSETIAVPSGFALPFAPGQIQFRMG